MQGWGLAGGYGRAVWGPCRVWGQGSAGTGTGTVAVAGVGLPGHGEGGMTDVLGGPGGMGAAPRRQGEG
jgi:hypothetical protein